MKSCQEEATELRSQHYSGGSMLREILNWITLGLPFVLTGGSWATDWGRQHRGAFLVAGFISLLMAGYFWRDRYLELVNPQKTPPRSTEIVKKPALPYREETQRRLEGLPSPPVQNIAGLVMPRMFVGTLPPNGNASIAYVVTNSSYAGGIDDVAVSAWALTGGVLKKVDERKIGFISSGAGRAVEGVSSPIPYGKAAICVSYKFDGKELATIYFFQSTGEYARYGPMREMQQFRAPITDETNGLICHSMPNTALSFMRG